MAARMTVPFYGHVKQYQNLKAELDKAWVDVMMSGGYVTGPTLSRFEKELAAYHEFHEAINGSVGLLRAGHGDPKEHADAISKAFGVLAAKRIELAKAGK